MDELTRERYPDLDRKALTSERRGWPRDEPEEIERRRRELEAGWPGQEVA